MDTSNHLGFRVRRNDGTYGAARRATAAIRATDVAQHRIHGDVALASSATFELPFEPGDVIAGRYRIRELIGVGGVGFVVSATHIGLDGEVALKFLKPELAAHPEAVSSFMLEARASFRIKNEHVARVLDVCTLPNGVPFMVMDLLEGEDLRRILGRQRFLPVDVAVDLVLQTCEALAAAHSCHVIHRDIKPENLFVTGVGHEDRVKVLDFGISKIAFSSSAPSRRTQRAATMMSVGTPPYMSPEQIRGSSNLDARADQWSLGCVLYELLTGVAPFARMSLMQACAAVLEEDPPPLREHAPHVSPVLEAAVMRCLSKRPDDRFDDIADFAAAIAPLGRRYVHCAERCAEMRDSYSSLYGAEPAAGMTGAPQFSRSRALRDRIPASAPSRRETSGIRQLPPRLQAIAAEAASIPVDSSVVKIPAEPSEDTLADQIPGLRPRRTGWIIFSVSVLAALCSLYVFAS